VDVNGAGAGTIAVNVAPYIMLAVHCVKPPSCDILPGCVVGPGS
jgi:hypothetical protein